MNNTKPRAYQIILGISGLIAFLILFLANLPLSPFQKKLASHLPHPIELIQLQGQLLDGRAIIKLHQRQYFVQWKTNFSKFFSQGIQLVLIANDGNHFNSKTKMMINTQGILVQEATLFQQSLITLLSEFDDSNPLLKKGQAELKINQLSGLYLWGDPWFTQVKMNWEINQFSWLGIAFHQFEGQLHSDTASADLIITGQAQEEGWRLTLYIILTPDRKFRIQIELSADTKANMPDWTRYHLIHQNDTYAILRREGEF